MANPEALLRKRFKLVGPVDPDRVLVDDYAYAELLEPLRNRGAGPLTVRILQGGGFENLTNDQQAVLRDGICQIREPMLGFLLKNSTSWYEGTFDVDALGTLRLTSWFESDPEFENARTVDELVDSPGGELVYRKANFRLEKMRGRPILLSSNIDGPYCIIEGTNRCCEMTRLARRGQMPGSTIPIVLAVCPNAHEYAAFAKGAIIPGAKPWWVPFVDFFKGALLTFERKDSEGELIKSVGTAFWRVLRALADRPGEFLHMNHRDFERFIAGCYEEEGYDEVILTSQRADRGRDVIAVKAGVGKVVDQCKRYKPGLLVTADEVRSLLYAAGKDQATKCFVTTTSSFAPRLTDDPNIAEDIDRGFLELRDGPETVAWLRRLEAAKKR